MTHLEITEHYDMMFQVTLTSVRVALGKSQRARASGKWEKHVYVQSHVKYGFFLKLNLELHTKEKRGHWEAFKKY